MNPTKRIFIELTIILIALVGLVWLDNQKPSEQFQLHPSILETILTLTSKDR